MDAAGPSNISLELNHIHVNVHWLLLLRDYGL